MKIMGKFPNVLGLDLPDGTESWVIQFFVMQFLEFDQDKNSADFDRLMISRLMLIFLEALRPGFEGARAGGCPSPAGGIP